MCQNLDIAPFFDMFASCHHHQLPRYLSANVKDTHAEGYNAFNYHWDSDVVLYINPPWSLLDQVIDTRSFKSCDGNADTGTKPYFSTRRAASKRGPRWATVFTFIPGRDAYKTEEGPHSIIHPLAGRTPTIRSLPPIRRAVS